MHVQSQAKSQECFQAERIRSRKDWCSYVELKTAIYRAHLARTEAELGLIQEGLRRGANGEHD
jgi:hypothetical protein